MSEAKLNKEVTYKRTGKRLAALIQPVVNAGASKRNTLRVSAGLCPACTQFGRIYKTNRQVRYCVCDHCGHNWNFDGPLADAVHDCALQLREQLKKFDIIEVDGEGVILWDAKSAAEVVQKLEELLP